MNRTVFLMDGGTKICHYNKSEDQFIIWTTVAVAIFALDLLAVIGNAIVILACVLQKQKTALIVYIMALAINDMFFALISGVFFHR